MEDIKDGEAINPKLASARPGEVHIPLLEMQRIT